MQQKIFVFILLLIHLSGGVNAQNDSLPAVTDSSGVNLFLMPGFDYGKAYGNIAYSIDISGGFEIGNFYVGAFGYSIINDIEINIPNLYENMQLDLGSGGLFAGYCLFSGKKIHFFPFVQIGWGVVSLSERKISNKVEYMERIDYDNVFIARPGAFIELPIAKGISFDTGINYFYMDGLDSLEGFSDNDFKDINYVFAVKLNF